MCLRSGGLLPVSSEFLLAWRQPQEYENGLKSEYISLSFVAPQWLEAYNFLEKPSWYFHFISDLWLEKTRHQVGNSLESEAQN